MQGSQGAVHFELLLAQESHLGIVSTALCLGYAGAELALAVLDGALLEFLDGALDFRFHGGLRLLEQSFGEQRALGRIFDGIHWIAGGARGQGQEGRE